MSRCPHEINFYLKIFLLGFAFDKFQLQHRICICSASSTFGRLHSLCMSFVKITNSIHLWKKWWEGLDSIISTFISTVFFCSSFVKEKNMNTYSLKVPVSGSSVITSCNASTQMLTMPQNLSWITLITQRTEHHYSCWSHHHFWHHQYIFTGKKMGQCYFAFTLLVTHTKPYHVVHTVLQRKQFFHIICTSYGQNS